MRGPHDARGPKAVARFLRPRSLAIVGISARAGSAGQVILQSLKLNNFKGDIHLVGRSSETIDGRPVLQSPDELPEGVDLAVFTLPAAGVRAAVEACARRGVGSALIFAAGFAEVGDQATQDAVTATARAGGLAVVGPNCLGVTNNVDGIWLHMLYAREAQHGVERGVAFVGQSGGLLGHFQRAADGRGLPLTYVISTGNEAGLESTDFLEFLTDDRSTGVIAIYCEQIRRPQDFLAACRRARAAGKPIVLMQAGRGAKARKAAQSHTGALIGDFATIRTQVEDAGAVVVHSMDEMMDLVELLVRYPVPPTKGPGILTASGAYVALTNDFADEAGLELPALDAATLKKVREVLPAYGNYGNPLDVTAGFSPDALPIAVKALLDDPNVGMLFISFPMSYAGVAVAFNKGMADSPKPKVMVALGDTWPLPPDIVQAVNESPAVFSRSSDRMLRAITLYTRYGRSLARARVPANPAPFAGMPRLGKGTQPEWLSKKILSAAGIRVPDGERAARRLPGRDHVAQGPRTDDRGQTRSRVGDGATGGARRHLGRGAGRRRASAGRCRRNADRRGAAQAARGEAAHRIPGRAARRRRSGGEGRPRSRPADADHARRCRDRCQPADGPRQERWRHGARCANRRRVKETRGLSDRCL